MALVHRDCYGRGRNPVGYHFEVDSGLGAGGNIEFSGDDLAAGSHTHGAVIMGARVEDMSGAYIGEPDQGIVGRGFKFVAHRGSLRQTIELGARDGVSGSTRN